MSSVVTPDEVDFTSAFYDTSTLYDYTLGQDGGEAKAILGEPSRDNVVSKKVKEEYENIRDNRKNALKSMLKAAGTDSFEDWEAPESLGLSVNDRDWCNDLHDELCDMESEDKIIQEITEAVRKFDTGHRTLFQSPDKWIGKVSTARPNVYLMGNLRAIINHRDDKEVVCGSVAWSSNGGSGTFVTSDERHMINHRHRILEEIERIRKCDPIHMLHPEEFVKLDAGNNVTLS